VDEHVVRIDLLLDVVEDERRGRGGCVELRWIDVDAVRGASPTVPFGLKRRARLDQREVDVEKNRADQEPAGSF